MLAVLPALIPEFLSVTETSPLIPKYASEFQAVIVPPFVAVTLPSMKVSDAEYAPNFEFLSTVTLPSMVVEDNFSKSSLGW